MELKVIKPFHGKVEDKVMDKGELIHSADVERINALVSGGFCAIVSLSDAPNENDNNANDDNAPKDDANITKRNTAPIIAVSTKIFMKDFILIQR